jgi:branched-chain amino acid transport system substrate-binding protein
MARFANAELAPKLKLVHEERARIAVVRLDNSNTLALADKLVSQLQVGGKTVVEGGAEIRQFKVDGETDKPDVSGIRREMVAFAPHIVFDLTGPRAFDEELYGGVEHDWPAGRPPPFYVSSAGAAGLDSAQVRALAARRGDARERIFAVDTPARLAPNVKLSIHYNEVYETRLTPETTYGPAYDAFYVVAYSIAALGDKPVTGLEMARAIPRLLPPGEPVDVGPGAIVDALKALRAGKNIDLAGTTTSLDFDIDTGDAPVDFAVMCLKRTARGELAAGESGVVMSARTSQLTGKLDCR